VQAVLMERILCLLEKNMGAAEIGQILATLHADDERVRPLLRSVDELRALLGRFSAKVTLSNEGGAEIAKMVLSPVQQEALARAREQQQRELQAQQQHAAALAAQQQQQQAARTFSPYQNHARLKR
jgi:hypothetical protein